MAKGKFEYWLSEEGLDSISAWCGEGLSWKDIAQKMGISFQTLKKWKVKYPEIGKCLISKDEIDVQVENALLEKALDGSVTAQIFWLKNMKTGGEQRQEESGEAKVNTAYTGISAEKIGKAFVDVHRQILAREYRHFDFKGGRGSLKSSFCGLSVVDEIMRNQNMCAMALRQFQTTLRDSVYAQITWAIDILGLEHEFKCTVSPMQIIRKATGQIIYFRGADEPGKIKSIKPPKDMYIGVVWFEEKDQFDGPEAIRSILQSLMRGGDDIITFSSYNTPASREHFINKEALNIRPDRLIHHSFYYDSPVEWLGKPFFDEAEALKTVNEKAYRHEYLGEAVGSGGNVFENISLREISDGEIEGFDRVCYGLDWGWFPDPTAFVKCYYQPAFRRLYIFGEFKALKTNNLGISQLLKENGLSRDDLLICDNSDNKAIADLNEYGLFARGAKKGPGSVNYSMKWLQGLTEIVIDSKRCPNAAEEFLSYQYEKTKDGEVASGYPDKNNHFIDAARYALNLYWQRRGV